MLRYAILGSEIIAFTAALVLLVITGYHGAMALDDVKPEYRFWARMPIARRYFATEEGSYHQRRAGIFFLLFVCSMGLFAAIIGIVGPQ